MAEGISIPSPAAFFNSPSLPRAPADGSTRKPARPSPNQTVKASLKPSESGGITKRKQSKSRNGCISCKAKRLKCDESKPTCQQCTKRGVECGGYKKDFKWKPFEESNIIGKPSSGKGRKASPSSIARPTSIPTEHSSHVPRSGNVPEPARGIYSSESGSTGTAMHDVFTPLTSPYPLMTEFPAFSQYPQLGGLPGAFPPHSGLDPSPVDTSGVFDFDSVDTIRTKSTAPSSISSGQSPRLVDLLLPGTDLTTQPEEYMSFRSQLPESFYQPVVYTQMDEQMEDEEVEEIPRTFKADPDAWVSGLPSPGPPDSVRSYSNPVILALLKQPQLSLNSPEMLTRRFNRDTCGILSVKDGPTENPWRTLILPLAKDSPALYHAIASMTAFHQSRDSPQLRLSGIDHVRSAVHMLAASLENLRFDSAVSQTTTLVRAISTTLVLAFSESWDLHISTGINHIKGAKLLLDKAIERHARCPLPRDEQKRLKFLSDTWIYMDVIARLTSVDDDQSSDYALGDILCQDEDTPAQLDPLMGCAKTLFPIIGRVANLARKVRNTESNSPSIIANALQLKVQLENWVPPAYIIDPEDETTSPLDSQRTAVAYQYATLLYLHQAVPEIPSPTSAQLAQRVMRELATVSPGSRAVIVQIYPLLAAGCEATEQEDREWVQTRWTQMITRMKLGIIDRCSDVTREVWKRRDEYVRRNTLSTEGRASDFSIASLKRSSSCISDDPQIHQGFSWLDFGTKRRAVSGCSSSDPPRPLMLGPDYEDVKEASEAPSVELLRSEFTIKGRLHWLGVMKDWKWEVLLG